MATHNQVRAVGFLREDPIIMNAGESGAEKVMFTIEPFIGMWIISMGNVSKI